MEAIMRYFSTWFDEGGVPRAWGSGDDQAVAEAMADIQRDEYHAGSRWDVRLVTRITREHLGDDAWQIVGSHDVESGTTRYLPIVHPQTCACENGATCDHGLAHNFRPCGRTALRAAPIVFLEGSPMCEPCITRYVEAGYGLDREARTN